MKATVTFNGKVYEAELTDIKEIKDEFPNIGDKYFIIANTGNVMEDNFENDSIDQHRLLTGNFFRTKEEAEAKLERITTKFTILKRIKELNDGWVADWNNIKENKYAFNLDRNKIIIGCYYYTQCHPNSYQFKSEQIGKQLLQEFGEEKIKTLFEI